MTVVYDPGDTTMKACVGSSWVTMAGGGGGGNLDGLSDVIISSPANNQVLLYNGSNWVNSAVTITENDPKVGALTGNQWCAANAGGIAIVCNQTPPSGGSNSSGTAGYVQLSGGSGAFTSSSTTAGNQLFWDSTNHRLGIGTTSPADKLTVRGTVTDMSFVDNADSMSLWGTTAGAGALKLVRGAYSWGVAVKNSGGLSFGPAFRIDNGGNLGSFGNNAAWVTGYDAALSQVTYSFTGDLDTGLYHPATNQVGLVTNGAERVRVDASGNVGIGTTTPSERLEVSGKVKATEFCNAAGTCIDIGSVPTLPTGAIMAFDLTTCPTGWSEYTAARGRFLRGIDPSGSTAVDPDGTRAPGNQQADDWKSFTMSSENVNGGQYQHSAYMQKSVGSYPSMLPNFTGAWSLPASATRIFWDSSEIRPKNVAVLYCRKN